MIGVHGGRCERADVHREVGTALRLPVRLPADVPLVLLPSRVGASRRRVCGEVFIGRRVFFRGSMFFLAAVLFLVLDRRSAVVERELECGSVEEGGGIGLFYVAPSLGAGVVVVVWCCCCRRSFGCMTFAAAAAVAVGLTDVVKSSRVYFARE